MWCVVLFNSTWILRYTLVKDNFEDLAHFLHPVIDMGQVFVLNWFTLNFWIFKKLFAFEITDLDCEKFVMRHSYSSISLMSVQATIWGLAATKLLLNTIFSCCGSHTQSNFFRYIDTLYHLEDPILNFFIRPT